MDKTKFKNINILKTLEELPETSKKNHWKIEYDKGLDYLYWMQPTLSRNSGLVNFGNEYSFYIDLEGKLEGVLVYYFKNNFVEHNEQFKAFSKSFTKEIDKNVFTISDNKQKDEILNLSKTILADTLTTVIENNEDCKNIKIPLNS